jgi:hypothetical protein
MAFIDYRTLEAIPAAEFRSAKPYPWVNPHGTLTEAGFFGLTAFLYQRDREIIASARPDLEVTGMG